MSINLIIQQQPKQARQCSGKEGMDRRFIDPPPILHIKSSGESNLTSPYLFVMTQLVEPTYLTPIVSTKKGGSTNGPVLLGNLAQSSRKIKGLDDMDMILFLFQDLSVKLDGVFKLRFGLYEIRNGKTELISTVFSDAFRVYQPKQFPGMEESTFLTKLCASQGLKVRVRRSSKRSSSIGGKTPLLVKYSNSTSPSLVNSTNTPKIDLAGWQGVFSNQSPQQFPSCHTFAQVKPLQGFNTDNTFHPHNTHQKVFPSTLSNSQMYLKQNRFSYSNNRYIHINAIPRPHPYRQVPIFYPPSFPCPPIVSNSSSSVSKKLPLSLHYRTQLKTPVLSRDQVEIREFSSLFTKFVQRNEFISSKSYSQTIDLN